LGSNPYGSPGPSGWGTFPVSSHSTGTPVASDHARITMGRTLTASPSGPLAAQLGCDRLI